MLCAGSSCGRRLGRAVIGASWRCEQPRACAQPFAPTPPLTAALCPSLCHRSPPPPPPDNCRACDPPCGKCVPPSIPIFFPNGTLKGFNVTVDFSDCEVGPLDWACCKSSVCQGNGYATNVTTVTYTVLGSQVTDFTTISVQAKDQWFRGDVKCTNGFWKFSGPGCSQCCGTDDRCHQTCGKSGVCHFPVDISPCVNVSLG